LSEEKERNQSGERKNQLKYGNLPHGKKNQLKLVQSNDKAKEEKPKLTFRIKTRGQRKHETAVREEVNSKGREARILQTASRGEPYPTGSIMGKG